MKNVAIDITHYSKLSGYGIVTKNIVDRLIKIDPDNKYFLISNGKINITDLTQYSNITYIRTQQNYFWYKFFRIKKILKKNHIDTFLSLDQTLPLRKVCRYIVVEHDIGFQRMGKRRTLKELCKRGTNKRLLLYYYLGIIEGYILRRADIIISPSYFTKNEIIDYYPGIPGSKIHVIYRGIDHITDTNKEKKKNGEYILFPYCNDSLLGISYKLAEQLIKEKIIDKVIFLKGGERGCLDDRIKIINGYISTEDNAKFFKNAKIIIYYSEYDGFGFIPLEAMAYRVPVIINKKASLQEISGDGAITIPDDDIEKRKCAIKELMNNTAKYENLVQKGEEITKRYRWDTTVNEILKLL